MGLPTSDTNPTDPNWKELSEEWLDEAVWRKLMEWQGVPSGHIAPIARMFVEQVVRAVCVVLVENGMMKEGPPE